MDTDDLVSAVAFMAVNASVSDGKGAIEIAAALVEELADIFEDTNFGHAMRKALVACRMNKFAYSEAYIKAPLEFVE